MPAWSCGLMDKALVLGTKDCRFESCQDHVLHLKRCVCTLGLHMQAWVTCCSRSTQLSCRSLVHLGTTRRPDDKSWLPPPRVGIARMPLRARGIMRPPGATHGMLVIGGLAQMARSRPDSVTRSLRGSVVRGPRPRQLGAKSAGTIPHGTRWSCGLMDKALVLGTGDCGFESRKR